MEDETPDVPGAWRLTLRQNSHGYRFALDAFLLADFVPSHPLGRVIELGSGCGIVSCLLARRFPAASIVGLELQAGLAAVSQRNVKHNGLGRQISIVRGDMRSVFSCLTAGQFAAVVCNPPYRAVGRGRLNPNPEKAIARHEVEVTMGQVVHTARRLLKHRGRLTLVYHPSRLAELCKHLEAADLNPRCLRFVHPDQCGPATMVLVESVRGGRDVLEVLPPLVVYQAANVYSDEMRAIFQGRALPQSSGL